VVVSSFCCSFHPLSSLKESEDREICFLVNFFIMAITGAEALEHEKEKAPSPRKAKLFKCGHHLCPGLGIHSALCVW
jgi:hypothetical protein